MASSPKDDADATEVLAAFDASSAVSTTASELASKSQSEIAAARLAPGVVIAGRYRLERFIASGGMGDVYEAVDLDLNQRLAIKTIREHVMNKTGTLDRVRREVQLARKVTSPHVCRIFDIGNAVIGDQPVSFITMEYLEGETLGARLKGWQTLPAAEALQIALDVLAGLEACHAAGVVHRDLKPENVLLVQRADRLHAMLTDFGIARAVTVNPEDDSSLTVEGMMVGSPAFMAPEQIEGTAVTPRTDVYAMAAVLWELRLGRWPLRGLDTLVIMRHIATGFPKPSDMPAGVDPTWAAVILACRQVDPAKRLASASAVAKALTTGEGLPSAAVERPRRAWRAGVALLAAVAVAAGLWAWRASTNKRAAPASGVVAAGSVATESQIETALNRLEFAEAQRLLQTSRLPSATAAYYRARAAAGLGEWDVAVKASAAALAASSTEAPLTRTQQLQLEAIDKLARGDRSAALDLYEANYVVNPQDPAVALDYLELLIPMGKAERAAEVLAALAAVPSLSPVFLARLQWTRAWALYHTAGFDQAELVRLLDAAATAAADVSAGVLTARAQCLLATTQLFQGRPDEAKITSQACLAGARQVGDLAGQALAHRVAVIIEANMNGDDNATLALAARTVDLYTRLRDDLGLALTQNAIAATLVDLGRLDEAITTYEASIASALRAERPDVADTRPRSNAALLQLLRGDIGQAIALYEALRQSRGPDVYGVESTNLALAKLKHGDLAQARQQAAKAIALIERTGNQSLLLVVLLAQAEVAYEVGDQRSYRAAIGRAGAMAKATVAAGEYDGAIALATARHAFGHGTTGQAATLVKLMATTANADIVERGTIGYLAARALLADGQADEARALRQQLAQDTAYAKYVGVAALAAMLDAELATTTEEMSRAHAALLAMETKLATFEYATARWDLALSLIELERRQGQAGKARARAAALAQETKTAGYLRFADLAAARRALPDM